MSFEADNQPQDKVERAMKGNFVADGIGARFADGAIELPAKISAFLEKIRSYEVNL